MTSLPRFSVNNPVLVNLFMVATLVGGAYCGLTLVREMFPESRPDQVMVVTLSVTVPALEATVNGVPEIEVSLAN